MLVIGFLKLFCVKFEKFVGWVNGFLFDILMVVMLWSVCVFFEGKR